MELKKRKYKNKEVIELVEEIKTEYEEKLTALQEKADALSGENKRIKAELESYKNSDKLISTVLKSAEEKAEEIAETAKLKYDLEIERLKNFIKKWNAYFDYLAEKYPYYSVTEQTKKIVGEIHNILGEEISSQDKIERLDKLLGEEVAITKFNPKKKIEKYIEESESGLNMEEILNPGQLDLGDLCKELGLMDEE